MTRPKVYVAAPFFCPAQLEIVEKLETLLAPYFDVFSPRRDGGILKPDAAMASRTEIFEMNYKHIAECDFMVAVIEGNDDRPAKALDDLVNLLGQRALIVSTGVLKDAVDLLKSKLPNYIDVGTVWEMGVAYEAGRPVIAFSPNKQRQINVMLSESVRGFVNEYDLLIPAIQTVLNGGQAGRHEGETQ